MKVLYQKLRQINNMKHKDRVTLCGVARSFIIVFRLVRDVVANHKTPRYAGAATKVIQKNPLA